MSPQEREDRAALKALVTGCGILVVMAVASLLVIAFSVAYLAFR